MLTYLLASFPSLSPEGPCPIRFRDFMRECAAHLSAADLEEVDGVCRMPPEGKSEFAKAWREALAQWRARNEQERRQRLSMESRAAVVFVESDQLRGDRERAWSAADPLQREKGLQLSLWNWIESRRRQAPYALGDLCGYALQLRMLDRREIWDEAEGQRQFQEHTQSFLEPVLEELRKQELSA